MLNSRYDRGERTTTTSTHEETGREATHSTESKRADTNGEQTESAIEPEHFDEELLAQFTRSDDEAGSIVLHVSCDTNEKEKGDEEADETEAAIETEEISRKDVEIRRLIEERRNTPKEEKQRLKEVSKRIKKRIRDKQR